MTAFGSPVNEYQYETNHVVPRPPNYPFGINNVNATEKVDYDILMPSSSFISKSSWEGDSVISTNETINGNKQYNTELIFDNASISPVKDLSDGVKHKKPKSNHGLKLTSLNWLCFCSLHKKSHTLVDFKNTNYEYSNKEGNIHQVTEYPIEHKSNIFESPRFSAISAQPKRNTVPSVLSDSTTIARKKYQSNICKQEKKKREDAHYSLSAFEAANIQNSERQHRQKNSNNVKEYQEVTFMDTDPGSHSEKIVLVGKTAHQTEASLDQPINSASNDRQYQMNTMQRVLASAKFQY